jgi:hypothetical protein
LHDSLQQAIALVDPASPTKGVLSVMAMFSPTDGQNESMNTSRIDDAIIFVGIHWTKVAMVIAKVAGAMGRDLPSGDEGCEVISEHIEVLIRAGRLEALGNTNTWRFSEVSD